MHIEHNKWLKNTAISIKIKQMKIKDGKYTLVERKDFEIIEESYVRNVNPGTASSLDSY